jgi:tetratricopeptide (TPR) repeat protein
MRRLKEAESALNRARRINPENVRATVALGAVAYLEKDFQKAVRLYTENLHLLPKADRTFSWPSHALNNLGWSYIHTGRYVEALELFKRLKAYHPKPIYPAVFNGLGWAYLYLEQEDDAKKAFEEALRLDPKNDLATSGLTIIRARR